MVTIMAISKKMKTTIDPAAAAAAPSTAATVILPEELIWEVLLRLPVKSLARFRCVCRCWNHLLRSDSDAAFQRLYSDRQASMASAGLVFAAARLAPPHAHELYGGLTIMPCPGCPRFVGGKPCHRGLALLSRPCTGYTLCNVSTGGLLRLPPCPTVGCFISTAGVGYLAATDEYKVVQLAVALDRPLTESLELDCQVLTVGAANGGGVRGGWRSVAIDLHGKTSNILIEIECMDPVFANGCLHWTLDTGMLLLRDGGGGGKRPEGILSFNLATESFATVPVPPFLASDLVPYDNDLPHASRLRMATTTSGDYRLAEAVMQPIGTALAELDGCLCMIRDLRRRRDVAAMFEVWKLKDYESGVWSLDYRIHEDLLAAPSSSQLTKKLMEPWLVIPICYLPSDDDDSSRTKKKKKILLATTAHEVHIYDQQTATLETIATAAHYPDPTNHDNDLYLVMYQESLLHIDGMEYSMVVHNRDH